MFRRFLILAALSVMGQSGASYAQANRPPVPVISKEKAKLLMPAAKKDYRPTLASFPDAGQAFDMQWSYSQNVRPRIVYGSPDTENILWEFLCVRQSNIISQNQKIAPTYPVTGIFNATTNDLRPNDQFGFTVRVDDGPSQGLLGQLGPKTIGNNDFYMPSLVLDAENPLFEKLANGKRAYIKIDGNRFSIDLTGSLQPIRQFVSSCKAKTTNATVAQPK